MRQELDAIPADAEGSALSQVLIEARANSAVKVIRWQLEDAFNALTPASRERIVRDFCERELEPHLKSLDPNRRHDIGYDFARTGDASGPIIQEVGQDLVRRWKLVVELRNVPFEVQRDVTFFIGDRLPKFGHAAFDATGNGAYLAEVCALRWGERVSLIKLSQEWYRLNATPYVTAFGEGTIEIAADSDIVLDHQALQYVGGVIKVPEDFRFKGSDGFQRHGDTAIGGMLAWYASRQNAVAYGYESVTRGGGEPGRMRDLPDDDEEPERQWWRPPLGARIRS